MENKRYKKARIPQRFWDKTLEDYSTSEAKGNAKARDAVAGWLADLHGYLDSGVGFTLAGPPGAGKTMLASIALMDVITRGHRGMFRTLASYLRLVQTRIEYSQLSNHTTLTAEEQDDYRDVRSAILAMINRYDVIVLDDVGKEHLTSTQWAQREFDYLVRHRFDKGLVTIITTNVKPADWGEQYGEAMASFIWEACPPIATTGADFRRED